MNEKFYHLPEEKQKRIINAGFRVFSQNSYRKSSVGEIASEADISKSLLFFYFKNKKELYFFLWETSTRLTIENLRDHGCYQAKDLFEALQKGLTAKLKLMREYPDLANFAIKAFYEKDPEVGPEILASVRRAKEEQLAMNPVWFDPANFVEGLDIEMMYRDMYLASEGLIWEKLQKGPIDVEQVEKEFDRMLAFWKSIYERKNRRGNHESNSN